VTPTLASLPPDVRLLLLAAGPAENDRQIARLLDGAVEWGRLSELAVEERAVTGVWTRLAPWRASISAGVRSHFAQVAMVTEFHQRQMEEQLIEVLHALASNGIHVVLLKGAALAATVYGSFAARPMNDVDLLVEPDRATDAHALLLDAGWTRLQLAGGADEGAVALGEEFYASHHHLWPLIGPRRPGVRLEIHTELLADHQPFAFGACDVWRDARPIELCGAEAFVPSTPHLLLHLCVHFAWGHAMGGAWRTFRDLQALVEAGDVDWPAFVALTQQSRAATCAYWTLRLAQALARVPVPPDVLDALRPSLPEAVLARLELHLAHEMIAPGALCPSVRLRRALWSAAIQPRRSGHGAARPWLHDGAFPVSGAARAEPRGIARWQAHLQRGSQWRRFLRTVVTLSPDAV
jgi:hypothetical protein